MFQKVLESQWVTCAWGQRDKKWPAMPRARTGALGKEQSPSHEDSSLVFSNGGSAHTHHPQGSTQGPAPHPLSCGSVLKQSEDRHSSTRQPP